MKAMVKAIVKAMVKAIVKAMVKAMVKASFLTTEDQENLYNQAHNARAAEDTHTHKKKTGQGS